MASGTSQVDMPLIHLPPPTSLPGSIRQPAPTAQPCSSFCGPGVSQERWKWLWWPSQIKHIPTVLGSSPKTFPTQPNPDSVVAMVLVPPSNIPS